MGSSDRPTLVFGTSGQVALALRALLPEAVYISQEACDFEHPESIVAVLAKHNPSVVINPSAYTQVDLAEKEFEKALKINAEAPKKMAEWCRLNGASLVHFSTDYVYRGDGDHFHLEDEKPDPPNRYGLSKLAGDQAIAASGCHYVILRTSWVFSPWGKNFMKTMLTLGAEREALSVVNDQIGSPTYAPDLARAVVAITEHPKFQDKTVSGVFHAINQGITSWHGFAEEIFNQARESGLALRLSALNGIPSSSYPTPAVRPKNSRLDTNRLFETLNVRLRPWQEALAEGITEYARLKNP